MTYRPLFTIAELDIRTAQYEAHQAYRDYTRACLEEDDTASLFSYEQAAYGAFDALMERHSYTDDYGTWNYHGANVWSLECETLRAYASWNGNRTWSYVIVEQVRGLLYPSEVLETGTRMGAGLVPAWVKGPLGIIAYKLHDHWLKIAPANEW